MNTKVAILCLEITSVLIEFRKTSNNASEILYGFWTILELWIEAEWFLQKPIRKNYSKLSILEPKMIKFDPKSSLQIHLATFVCIESESREGF